MLITSHSDVLGAGCFTRCRLRGANGKPQWSWDGGYENPTIRPSIKAVLELNGGRPTEVCHSYVKDGQIEFLGDCTHSLKGTTVSLNEVE